MPLKDKAADKKYKHEKYMANREQRLAQQKEYRKERDKNPIFAEERRKICRDSYHKNKHKRDPIVHKARVENNALKAKYGMTREDYDIKYKELNGECEICKRQPTVGVTGSSRPLVIDHCHNKNYVRGLLCSQCNILLGMAQNSVETLAAAILYLQRQI